MCFTLEQSKIAYEIENCTTKALQLTFLWPSNIVGLDTYLLLKLAARWRLMHSCTFRCTRRASYMISKINESCCTQRRLLCGPETFLRLKAVIIYSRFSQGTLLKNLPLLRFYWDFYDSLQSSLSLWYSTETFLRLQGILLSAS